MTQFLLLTALLLGSALLVRGRIAAEALADHLNWWVIYVALTAMVLELVPTLPLHRELWYLVVSQWSLAALTALVFGWLGPRLGWSRGRIGAVILLAGFSNTAFLGYPLVEALRGHDALALAVVADQLGAFIALAIGGAVVLAVYSGERPSPRTIALKVLLFPAFLAVIAGLIVGAAGGWPAAVPPVLHRLGQTLAPLALFSVGLRLRVHLQRDQRAAALLTLGWKLGLMPLLAWAAGLALSIQGTTFSVGVLETAMAPMFTAAILARQHDFDPTLVDSVLSLGMVLSFLTVPAWSLCLP